MIEDANPVLQEALARLSDGNFEQVICLNDQAAARLDDGSRCLTEAIAEQTDRSSVVIRGREDRGGRGALYDALSRWMQRSGQQQHRATISRLFDYLTMAMDMESTSMETTDRAELIVDTVVRLVERLVTAEEVVVAVVQPQQLTSVERRAVESVMHHFLGVTIPGVEHAQQAPPVGFIWAGPPGDWPRLSTETVDSGGCCDEAVRRFLSDDRVVERITATTGGDPKRLDALLGALPETVSQLWARRVRELTPPQRRVVEYLAVADEPLEVGFVDRLVDVSAVSVLHRLGEGGVIQRRMNNGAVQIQLAGADVRDGIVETLDDQTRRQLHLVLAQTARQAAARGDAFIARHAFLGGDEQMGVRRGLPAAQTLLRRGRWEGAEQLLELMLDSQLPDDEQRREILELSLRLAEAKGQWQRALQLTEQLAQLDESAVARARYQRRRADFLMRLGRVDEAMNHFESALQQLDDEHRCEQARAMIGSAQLAYQRGDLQGACDRAVEAAELLALEGDDHNPAVDRLRVECGNVLGKVALYRGELEEARQRFEGNASLARQLGEPTCTLRAEMNLGVVAVQQRRYGDAQRRLQRALDDIDLPADGLRMNCWLNLGIVCQRRGEFGRALQLYRKTLREALRRRDDISADVATYNLATLYQDMGAYDEARELIGQLRARGEQLDDSDERGRFAGRWAVMVQGQLYLEQGDAARALEAFDRARRQFDDDQLLYALETELRCARAHLSIGQIDDASEILDAASQQIDSDHRLEPLYRYCCSIAESRRGQQVDQGRWRAIIDDLEQRGSYYDAMGARVQLARQLLEDSSQNGDVARLVIERGVEDLRQRAQSVPERFLDGFFAIPVHQQLLALMERAQDERLPADLRRYRNQPSEQQKQGSDVATAEADRDSVERDDPAYRRWRSRYASMIGEHQSMLQVFQFIDRVAPGDTTVLLSGESGTGKELVAEAIHRQSQRVDGPFLKVNCAAFVEELLLSELFGHEEGAFTGAISDRQGRFERADGGTIFLDEIGDISPKTQVALLRVLQEGTFETVGGTETRQVDVRVVAATNRNLEQLVQQGEFRLDLYYRLKGFVIDMPPLRERREDIPRLLKHFARRFSPAETAPRFTDDAIQFLSRYRWPGNVRELENFVRSVLLFTRGDDDIGMEQVGQFGEFFSQKDINGHLPDVDADVSPRSVVEELDAPVVVGDVDDTEKALVEQVVADERSLSSLKKRLEHKCIKRALRETGGNITQAARILQMKRPRLSQIVNGDDELLALKEELVG